MVLASTLPLVNKVVLIIYRGVQDLQIRLSAVCLYGLYNKLDTILLPIFYELVDATKIKLKDPFSRILHQ